MSATPPNDPLAFGRQLWQQWNDALQTAVPSASAAPAMPDWTSAMRQWTELAGGGSMDANRAADKLGMHGQQFFSLMQQLVQRASAGVGPTSMPDLTTLWRTQLGDGNPIHDALKQITAEGARSWEQLFEGARGAMQPAMAELMSTLKLPGFGQGRERQAQVGELIAAQVAQAEAVQAYQRLLQKASEAGMQRFEDKLAEHSEPGRQIGSMRALYDLWIDAAEEAYAQVALSPEFREVYAKVVNTQMRAKQLQQKEIERLASEAGMPTRSELDGVLRRIHDLQRDLRSLRNSVAAQASATVVPAAQTRPTTAAPTSQPAKSSKPIKTVAAPAPKAKNSASQVVQPAPKAKSVASKPTPPALASKPVASKPVIAKAAASKSTASKSAANPSGKASVAATRRPPVQPSLSAELEQAPVSAAPPTVAAKRAAKRVSKGA
ncbi:MAG: class III poly(R)-hydroxyalkanoic acid synthase subunit PhaE [Pseudomarimonas sp.]